MNAVNAMLEGKADVACPATEFVLVGRAFNKEPVQTIASIDKVDYAVIVGRKDRGIESPFRPGWEKDWRCPWDNPGIPSGKVS